jgi:Mg2+ and Co2+ transporter CorA
MAEREKDGMHRVGSDEAIIMWPDLYKVDREERRRQLRESVDRVFSDYLMMGLSLILLPIILIPFFWAIPEGLQESFDVIDYAIVIIFILEYVLKLAVADARKAFVLNPWHLLDLFIIAVALAGPIVNALTGSSYNKTSIAVVLRLLRIPAAISLGGRSVKRREEAVAERKREEEKEKDPLARYVDLENAKQLEWEVASFPPNVEGGGKWTHVSNVSPQHLSDLGSLAGIPKVLLDGKTRDIAYPRAEMLSGVPSVFMRVPEVYHDASQLRYWFVEWRGILFLDTKDNLISISRHEIPSVLEIPADARAEDMRLDPAAIVLQLAQKSVRMVEEIISAAELEQVRIEAIPVSRQPRIVLSVTYNIKKEVGQARTWLRHMRVMMNTLIEGEVPLRGWEKEDADLAKALLERVDYLDEAANGVIEAFSDAIDFYLNNTSFQMNKVMKVIAVLTALAIIPTVVGGLLGMNLIGNPWPVTLGAMITIVIAAMAFTAWVYIRLGWLKS